MEKAPEARVFSIEEANSLVPTLQQLVGSQLDLADEIQELVSELGDLGKTEQADGAAVVDITLYPDDAHAVRALKRKLAKRVAHYRQGWAEVQDLGVVVKDTATGLLDFYGRIDDRLVCLCWRYGENGVDHYHDLDAGLAGRKPLADVRKRMLN